MPLAITILYVIPRGPSTIVGFNVTPSGNYSTGGDTLNFAAATPDPNFEGLVPAILNAAAPLQVAVWSQGGNLANDYAPVQPTPNSQSWKLKICANNTFGTELAAAAYAAPVTTDLITGEAVFPSLL